MRHANDASIMKIDDKLIGFNLGADYCGEHERGIKDIIRDFQIDNNKIGIERRMITVVPETLIYKDVTYNKLKCHLLVFVPRWYIDKKFKITKKNLDSWELYNYFLEDGITTSWDDKSFAILTTDKYKKELKELYQAFLNLDVAIGIGPSEVFKNGGLKLCIKSKLPEDMIEKIKEDDLDYISLQEAAEKTNIKELLKNTGKEYYSLSPKWKDENKKEVIFWLNPYKQDIYNSGWYTVEDLKDWANNKGKVLIQGENK